jgi:hypothetical protein
MSDPIAFDTVTPRMSLPLLFAAQAQKELFHNEALARIDALLHPTVQDEANEAPVSAQDGESWLVGAAPSGAWAEHAGALATYRNGGWIFTDACAGMRVFNLATGQSALFVDTWQKAAELQEPSGGLYVDSQARAAIGALISALRAAGIYPPA